MNDPGQPRARHMVPPNSTATRELLLVISAALAVPPAARRSDETACLLLTRQRAQAVTEFAGRLLEFREADEQDVMAEVANLRDAVAGLPLTYKAAQS
jgi:hypothetical protein